MAPGQALILGAIVVLVFLILVAFVWYHFTGWKPFKFAGRLPYDKKAAPPGWAETGKSVSSLRFKNCVFTVTTPRGTVRSADVTSVLNGMAVAYRKRGALPPKTLRLDRPLNAFSFLIFGVNDSSAVPTAADAARWANSATSLSGLVRAL